MEEKINKENEPIESGKLPQGGVKGIVERIDERKLALKEAKEQIEKANYDLFGHVILWSVICGIIIFFSIFLSILFLNTHLPCWWTWQIIYYTIIRITIISAVFTFAGFCFKMLRSHIHMYQYNKHRERVINGMASYVESVEDPVQRESTLIKLIEIVTDFGSSGIISKEKAVESAKISPEILSLLIKLSEKK